MNTTQTYARRYHAAGICTLPIAPDGSKAPPPRFKWGGLQNRLPTEKELSTWFSNGHGLAAIGGHVSGNLEDFDFDHLPSFEAWRELIIEHLGQSFFDSLLIVQTPRPGRAVIIRCPSGVANSHKLAYGRNPKFGASGEPEYVCLIETKAEKGYFILPGSPARCHPSGRTYEVLQGSFDAIPAITSEQREVLLTCARSFDERPREIYNPPKPRESKPGEQTPGDDYNEHGPDWSEMLPAHGYKFAFTRGDTSYWTRPGKAYGVSASTNHAGSGKFYPFSTNCYPFDSNRGYSKFAFFALTECNGDFGEAARTLGRKGYGTPRDRTEPRSVREEAQPKPAAVSDADEERAAIQAEGIQVMPESFIDPASSFLAFEDPPLEYLIPEITPRGALKCSHGDPRTMKSLAALEEFIAAGTGTPAFGLERFRPSRSYRALYCSQEDAAAIVRPRVKKMLVARGITTFPGTLAFAVYKGIDFDSPEWRERFVEEILRGGYEHVTVDPIRHFTAFADAGPKEVVPIAKFLRRLTSKGVHVHLVHHDVKPPQSGPDARKRSHRASGGAWFSVSECPVSFEKVGDRQSVVSPEDYKFSQDPQPFTITYSEDETGIRLTGENSSAEDAATLAIDEKVLFYLDSKPGASGNQTAKDIRKQKDAVLGSLDRLYRAGKVDYVERGRAKLWTVRRAQ